MYSGDYTPTTQAIFPVMPRGVEHMA